MYDPLVSCTERCTLATIAWSRLQFQASAFSERLGGAWHAPIAVQGLAAHLRHHGQYTETDSQQGYFAHHTDGNKQGPQVAMQSTASTHVTFASVSEHGITVHRYSQFIGIEAAYIQAPTSFAAMHQERNRCTFAGNMKLPTSGACTALHSVTVHVLVSYAHALQCSTMQQHFRYCQATNLIVRPRHLLFQQ